LEEEPFRFSRGIGWVSPLNAQMSSCSSTVSAAASSAARAVSVFVFSHHGEFLDAESQLGSVGSQHVVERDMLTAWVGAAAMLAAPLPELASAASASAVLRNI
jgi:hypothetical protein